MRHVLEPHIGVSSPETRVFKPLTSWKWANHLDEILLLFEGSQFKSYKWVLLEDGSTQSDMAGVSDFGISTMTFTGFYLPSQCRNACLVMTSSTSGTTAGASVHLFSAEKLNPAIKAATSASISLEMIKDLKAIVGTYKSWLLYLQHGGMICTIKIDTASHDRFYMRKFPCTSALAWCDCESHGGHTEKKCRDGGGGRKCRVPQRPGL